MKNFTKNEVDFIVRCIESFGQHNGIRYFQHCALMANKVMQEYETAKAVDLAANDLAPAGSDSNPATAE